MVDIHRGAWPATLVLAGVFALSSAALEPPWAGPAPIDRHALVTRHNVELTRFDPESPLSVGNGEFAFTVDVTGPADLPGGVRPDHPARHAVAVGLAHVAQPRRLEHRPVRLHGVRQPRPHGRLRGHSRRAHAGDQLAARQPAPPAPRAHRLPADARGRLRGGARRSHRRPADARPLERRHHQPLPLRRRTGRGGDGVPSRARRGRACGWCRRLSGPGGSRSSSGFPTARGRRRRRTGRSPDAHRTVLTQPGPDEARFARTLDADALPRVGPMVAGRNADRDGPHAYVLDGRTGAAGSLGLTVAFTPAPVAEPLPAFDETRAARRAAHWNRFWSTGGAIDLSGSTDPRWRELERRIVLSQYLTAIQCAGRYPAAGDRADLQQLGGQVPPRDALVARGALRAVGPPAAARAQPRLLPAPSCRRPGPRRRARATPARAGRR